MLRRIARLFLLTSMSFFLTLLLAEGALRLAGVSYPSFYVADHQRGTSLRPRATGWQRQEGEAHVSINSQGLRDREHEFAKKPGTYRIAVLGDSYTYASQVSVDRTFWAVLAKELEKCEPFTGRDVEAINFGVSGYGTAQSLLTLRHHAWDYSPDLVLLALFAGNDIADNSRAISGQARTPYFVLEGDRLVLDDSFLGERGYKFRTSLPGRVLYGFLNYSRVVQLVNRAVLALQNKARLRALDGDLQAAPLGVEAGIDPAVFKPPQTPEWRDAWKVTERLLETMRDEVAAHNAKFLVTTLSAGIQVHPNRTVRSEFMTALDIEDIFYPDRRLEEFASRSSIPILVLAQEFQRQAEEKELLLHGFTNGRPGFGHWNENGHQLAGERMAARICSLAKKEAAAQSSDGSP